MKKDNLLKQFTDAYKRLQDALGVPLTMPLALDGTIQRFEFTFELGWKTLKTFLEDQGIVCYSPKNCLKEAFKMEWIDNEDDWLSLLKARNMTSHVYSEEMATEIYKTIKNNHNLFHALISALENY
ncbi:MAG: nucleotidyltransferase substrate binding protein [Proteobacteria bacterium]|nr:nucleotidyltransferase substrate binding protein [Pseudomonadota bacterium]